MAGKMKWTVLLFGDVLLFFFALQWNDYFLYLLVILLSFWISQQGTPILFKEYNEGKKQKLAMYQQAQATTIKEATKMEK